MVRPLSTADVPGSPGDTAAERRTLVLLALITAGCVAFWYAPLPIEPRAQHAIAIGIFMIASWMLNLLDHGIIGIMGCTMFWITGLPDGKTLEEKFGQAFSGFAGSTPWFLFGAICFGMMGSKSGLAKRLAYMVMRRVGHSYPRLLLGLIVSNFLLTPVVPSGIARVVIMAAIAVGLIEAFGFKKGSNSARGMFLILVYQATIFDKMVIAGAAAITAMGAIVKYGHVQVLWSQWALAYLPADLILMLVAWRLTLWMYPPEEALLPVGTDFIDREITKMGPWSPAEKRAAILMSAATIMWCTDAFHHITPAMIGLAVGLLAVIPGIGVINSDDVKKVNWLPVFFVAAAASLSTVLAQTGALAVLTDVVFAWMQPLLHGGFLTTVVLYWSAFVYHIFIGNEISMLATSIPILMNYATTHGLDPLQIGMIWTFGAGPKIFIYESAVLVVGYSYGYFTGKDLLKIGLLLALVDTVLLLLMVPFYWPLIGIGR